MAKSDRKRIQRTIQYWRLVRSGSAAAVDEQDWYAFMKRIYGRPITHRVVEKDISGKVFSREPDDLTAILVKEQLADHCKASYDGAVYALVLSTDKDHVPSQRHRTSGDQKPMSTDDQHVPVDNTFVWFLPMGNLIAVLQENQSAIRAQYICGWLDRALRDEDLLPSHNFHWDAAPVIDPSTREALRSARGLRSATLGASVPAGETSGLRTLLGGDANYEGEFELEIKIRHIKKRNPSHHDRDAEKTLRWFEETFGQHADSLKKANVVLEGPGRRPGEIDMLRHRMTRKAQVQIEDKGRSINSSSAMHAIMKAFAADAGSLVKLRKQ